MIQKEDLKNNKAVAIITPDYNTITQELAIRLFNHQSGTTERDKEHFLVLLRDYTQKELKKKNNRLAYKAIIENGKTLFILVYQVTRKQKTLFTEIKNTVQGKELLRNFLGLKKIYKFLQSLPNEKILTSVLKLSNSEKAFEILYNFKISNSLFAENKTLELLQKRCSDLNFCIKLAHDILSDPLQRFKFLMIENTQAGGYILSERKIFIQLLISFSLGKDQVRFSLNQVQSFLDTAYQNYNEWFIKTKQMFADYFPQYTEYIFGHIEMTTVLAELKNGVSIIQFAKSFFLDSESAKKLGQLKYAFEAVFNSFTVHNYEYIKSHTELIEEQKFTLRIGSKNGILDQIPETYPYLMNFLSKKHILNICIKYSSGKKMLELQKKAELFNIINIGDFKKQDINKKYSLDEILSIFWSNSEPFGLERKIFLQDFNDESVSIKSIGKQSIFTQLYSRMKFNFFCDWLNHIYDKGGYLFPEAMLPEWFLLGIHYMAYYAPVKNTLLPKEYFEYEILPDVKKFLLNNTTKNYFNKYFDSRTAETVRRKAANKK